MKRPPPGAPTRKAAANFTPAALRAAIQHNILSFQGRDPDRAGRRDIYKALSYAIRDILVQRWIETQKSYYTSHRKRVYYLSLEFLVGRSLGNSLINLGLLDNVDGVLKDMGYSLDEIREMEEEAALGNGGLGRLAACYLDSLATLGIPAYGYGIHYEYGLFHQRIIDGFQVESPDNWLRYGNPWEFERQSLLFPVQFFGRVEEVTDADGRRRKEWKDADVVMAMPCDILIPGYGNGHVINMRLWKAHASREIDLCFFNRGDYLEAVKGKVRSETISKVLYPSDDIREGQELRLKQQYFFVAATFQDILRRTRKDLASFDDFPDRVAIQLNDTHPAIAIPEFMRLLVDGEGLLWDKAWDICVRTFGYTNHTLMPEALEHWPVDILGRILPRHLEIIYEINQRFLDRVAERYPGDGEKRARMSLIAEGEVKRVRMAHLAIVGSHSVNGVAALHSRLLRERVFPDFDAFFPGRFNNKTNGITPRRWLLKCNPDLARLIDSVLGDAWHTDLTRLAPLAERAADADFQARWRTVKLANKERLARLILERCGVDINPASLFDVHVKRIHEYKRQLLNALHVVALYHRMLRDGAKAHTPRTVIFAGKAAPSYTRAKLIIRLITAVAGVVNHDPRIGGRLKVAFLPNYNVTLAERIIPAADLSEQISTAGTEASGTGNMKLSLNGALTIGTLDGANIEILEEVGRENIFIFGLTAEEAELARTQPTRTPEEIRAGNQEVREVVEAIAGGVFSGGDRDCFRPIVEGLMSPRDPYLLLTDLEDYLRCQTEVGTLFRDEAAWTRKSILNVARMEKFSSDRSIREYARDIWGVPAGQ